MEVFEIHVFSGSFEDNLAEIARVCKKGFTFTFIDPTGWNIRSEPVFEFLSVLRGEFLLNFMSEHVNRHAGWEQVSVSFGRFLADPDWRDEFVALPSDMSNEERVLILLKRKIKNLGAALFLPDIPILKPRENRLKMRLILGTFSRKGLEVFRDVHENVKLSEIQTRKAILEKESNQLHFWEQIDDDRAQQRANGVGSALERAASEQIVLRALERGPLLFDHLASLVMEQRAMRLTHTKDLLNQMRQQGQVSFRLQGREKKPQPDTVVHAAPIAVNN